MTSYDDRTMPESGYRGLLRGGDAGAALLFVIGLGAVMIVLITTGLTVAVSGMQQANSAQNRTSALDAAYAGVQDYLARVNVDPTYVKYGNPASKFSTATGSRVTLPAATNPAFGNSKTGSGTAMGSGTDDVWAVVPGSGSFAKFRYEVDNSTYSTSGVIRLQVTGMAGDRTKTLLANLRVRGFIDYSYFTDYEIQDPQISGAPQSCVLHAWEGRPTNCGGVTDTRFGPSDAISGDVHSNDTFNICSSTFTGNVTTANTTTPLYNNLGCTVKTVNITRATALAMPATNSSMKTDAACLYTGPTKVTYNGDGTMTVISPWTKFTRVTGTTGTAPSACGDPAALKSYAGATVPQLDNDLLYVQNVPAITTDPNYWNTTTTPTGVSCLGSDGLATTAATGPGWSLTETLAPGATNRARVIRYPLSNESPSTGWTDSTNSALWNTTTPAYGCRNGDLYVSGTVSTLTTAGSENYVYVVGDIAYADQTADVLGLVGQNAVLVWNPMDKSDQTILTDSSRNIAAAILSVAHTFQVQNFDRGGTRGSLNLFGSIAQKFRGPVGTSGNGATGYSKSYAYDPLLKTVSPPKFLAPSSTSFSVTRYASVPVAFASNGLAR